MKTFLLGFINISIFLNLAFASEQQDWSVKNIPLGLIYKSNAVIRYHNKTLTVFENGNAEETVHIVITIINEKGLPYKYLIEEYNKYCSISEISGAVYDKNGIKIKKIKKGEILDISAIQGYSLYEDNRVKVINPQFGEYPFTIEYRFKKKHNSFFILPGWQVIPGYNVSVQNTSYNLKVSPLSNVKFKENQWLKIKPNVTIDQKGFTSYSWSLNNLESIEQEPLSESLSELTPTLTVAPNTFNMDGYGGSNNSWKDFGAWVYRLGEGKDILSQETIEKINNLVEGLDSDLEKAKIIYEYMQSKVRYVNISIGIGGWQPLSAESVDKLWYGDCKALTNYMKSLLSIAGVNSYYCLVKSGIELPSIDRDFICSQFNHAFLMIPFEKDTLFLECTDQHLPFGFNGSFTDDRNILVVDRNNSYIRKTNQYTKDQNKIESNYLINLFENNGANITITKKYFGAVTDEIRHIMYSNPEKQREFMIKNLLLKNIKINNIAYREDRDVIPIIIEQSDISIKELSQKTSNSTHIIPFNQFSLLSPELKKDNKRNSSIVIKRERIDIDSLIYMLPPNHKIEKLPIPISISSDFGYYSLESKENNDKVIFVRYLEWKKGKHSPEEYEKLLTFFNAVNEADRQLLIYRKK